MIIIGAGGLGKQILDVIERLGLTDSIAFFDNVTKYNDNPKLYQYTIIQKIEDLIIECGKRNKKLILGIGKPQIRKLLYDSLKKDHLNFHTLISSSALIGKNEVEILEGAVIMEHVIIESSVKIGKGVLINTSAKVFHDSIVGDFCEIAPNCSILGKCKIGNEVFIGANATVLPGIEIGDHAVIGAGAVVTKNVVGGSLIKGIPGKVH